VSAWEREVFWWGNAGGPPEELVWTVMQLGNLTAVPAVALVALVARRVRLAVELSVAGTTAYLLARVLKELVDRGRPAELLADVQLRGAADAGRGFPSGHAAVVTALACLVLPHLPARWRWTVAGTALLVCLARVQVGAHLPLDVVGGAAVGVACASAVLLGGGARRGRRDGPG
jgi:undecaprenyl-diphosphatase